MARSTSRFSGRGARRWGCSRSTRDDLRRLARRLAPRAGRAALRGGFLLGGGGFRRGLAAFDLLDAALERLHQVDDRRLRNGLGLRDLLAVELRLEHLAEVTAVLAVELRRIELRNEALHHLLRQLELGVLDLHAGDRLVDLRLRAHVLGEEERLEEERIAFRADEAEVLGPAQYEAADAAHAGLLHRLEQQHVRAPLGRVRGRREVVRAVEVDGVDVVELDKARDVDRARVVVLRDRLEVGVLDDHEFALRDLPALHDLVRADLAVVRGAPALLADRRPTLAMKRAEADVRLLRLRRRRESQANGDVDQAERDGSIPDRAHGARL